MLGRPAPLDELFDGDPDQLRDRAPLFAGQRQETPVDRRRDRAADRLQWFLHNMSGE